jgi:hypothetical protein
MAGARACTPNGDGELMKISLKSLVVGAHKNGMTVGRFRISNQEAQEIRAAEAVGGSAAELNTVLGILKTRNQVRNTRIGIETNPEKLRN